jgi:hypothetical protein
VQAMEECQYSYACLLPIVETFMDDISKYLYSRESDSILHICYFVKRFTCFVAVACFIYWNCKTTCQQCFSTPYFSSRCDCT